MFSCLQTEIVNVFCNKSASAATERKINSIPAKTRTLSNNRNSSKNFFNKYIVLVKETSVSLY